MKIIIFADISMYKLLKLSSEIFIFFIYEFFMTDKGQFVVREVGRELQFLQINV